MLLTQGTFDYIKIKDQYVHFITAITDGLSDEQAKDRNGKLLYWKDEDHLAATEEVTDWPVMQYVYQEDVKASLGFEMVDGNNIPVFVLGAGSGNGDSAKFYIRKHVDEVSLTYYHSMTNAPRQLDLSDNGVVVTGSTGANGIRNIYVGANPPDEPETHMLWINSSEQLRRWNGSSWVSVTLPSSSEYVYVNTLSEAVAYSVGQKVISRGYYSPGDGGGGEYIVSSSQLPWSIPLGSSKYANIIKEDYVNYRMFGATLTGTRDQDTQDIKKCHQYADSIFTWDQNNAKVFHCWVKNNGGIIRVTETIYCSGNVDLSGSTIIVDDVSASWFGTYVWGQNSSEYYSYNFNPELRTSMKEGAYRLEGLDGFPENVVMHLTETHYEIRDDDGYLYDVNKGELMVHKQGGIFSTALGSDWDRAGGTLIFNEGENAFMTTELVVQYTYLTSVHREFIGCEVIFDGDANNYCSVIWVKGHNCTVRDFTFRPKPHVLANTAFKNSMIYVWGSYKVTIRNCNGMNASGKITPEVPTPTSGYAIRAFQACDLVIEDCNIMGIWGSISVSSTKNCYMSRVTCNRIDVHDYIVNLFVNACIVYSHMFQIGYGSGSCVISDSVFYYQHIPEERYPTPYLFALQTGYGRIFNGKIAIQNCKMIFLTKDTPKEFSLIWARFRPDARSVERKYRFPDITIRDFSIDTVTPDALNIIVCDFRGQN